MSFQSIPIRNLSIPVQDVDPNKPDRILREKSGCLFIRSAIIPIGIEFSGIQFKTKLYTTFKRRLYFFRQAGRPGFYHPDCREVSRIPDHSKTNIFPKTASVIIKKSEN